MGLYWSFDVLHDIGPFYFLFFPFDTISLETAAMSTHDEGYILVSTKIIAGISKDLVPFAANEPGRAQRVVVWKGLCFFYVATGLYDRSFLS